MITAKKINEIQERWGIDVVVQFFEEERKIDITKTFRFDSQKEIGLDYEERMAKSIANIESKIAESKVPKNDDIAIRVEEYFEENATMSKTVYENIKTAELTEVRIG